jgi:hypothetical protein
MTETANTAPVPAPVDPARDEGGKFLKGTSGNPLGRPKGSKNAITLARLMLEEQLRETLQQKGPRLLNKAIRMAMKGDDKIMRVLLDKMLATPRGEDSDDSVDRKIQIVVNNLTNPDPKQVKGTVVLTVPSTKGEK